jgi:hypothetical protein
VVMIKDEGSMELFGASLDCTTTFLPGEVYNRNIFLSGREEKRRWKWDQLEVFTVFGFPPTYPVYYSLL